MEDNINISDLEAKKKELENKLLQLQINHFDKSKKPIAFYVTLSISIITIAWTIIQGFNTIISKNKEIELSNNQFINSQNEQERR